MVVRSGGFTLIELLVVIAIIGMLATIVLTSLGSARTKGKDSATISELDHLRNASELYANLNGYKYQTGATAVTTCNAASTFLSDTATGAQNIIGAIATLINGSATTYTNMDCGIAAGGGSWSVAVKLPGGAYWCMDSVFVSRGTTVGGTAYAALTGLSTAAHTAVGSAACN